MEDGDADPKATALREAKEEIGLDPALVNVVTVLEPFLSKVSYNCCSGTSRKFMKELYDFTDHFLCRVV